jgi:hypothetical protein
VIYLIPPCDRVLLQDRAEVLMECSALSGRGEEGYTVV